jgi:hypothetical protein
MSTAPDFETPLGFEPRHFEPVRMGWISSLPEDKRAGADRSLRVRALRSANYAQRRFIEIAKCGRLTPLSQNPQEQPARQVSRSRAAQMITPLKTKLVGVEGGKARDSRVERFSLSRRRRLQRKTLSDVARSPSLRHHAACCARGLPTRRAFFDFRARDIAGGASL